MATFEWNQLETFEEWANALRNILDAAEVVIEGDDSNKKNKKLELQKLLFEFVKRSPSRCADLDDIARKAADDIFRGIVSESIKAIADRSIELKEVTDLVKSVTEDAKKDQKAILFENVIEGIDRITGTAKRLKSLKGSLSASENDLLAKIEDVTEAVENYKNSNTD